MIPKNELLQVSNAIDINSLTTEASTINNAISKALKDLGSLVEAHDAKTLTTENARSYLVNLATESDILDFESVLTTEDSYAEGIYRTDAKLYDIIVKIFTMIMNIIKKFINIFKQLITKIRIASASFDKRAVEINNVLSTKTDISGNISINDLDLKKQVYSLIGVYAVQYDSLTLNDGIATALTTPKDYGKLVSIIEGLSMWNDSLLNENVFDLNDYGINGDWSKRHTQLKASWDLNVANKKIPSALRKLAENVDGNIFGSSKHIQLSGWGRLGFYANRLGSHNLAFLPFGLDGTTIHLVTAYNQDVGMLMIDSAEVAYNVKDLNVDYPTISLMQKCLYDITKHDYRSMERDIVNVLDSVEKEFKSKINTYMSDKLNNDTVNQLHITKMLRGIYSSNINTINNVAMSIVTHTLRNNNNLVKYIDLMASQLPNK